MSRRTPPTHSFSLVADGLLAPTAEIEDALFESGCDDALLAFEGPLAILAFDREADSLEEAVISAIHDVTRAGVGARIVRVTPDDLVTAADIARRSGRSREGIRLWIAGQRRDGGFPAPVAILDQSKLWSWREVADWLARRELLDPAEARNARFLAALNAALRVARTPALASEARAVADRLPEAH